MSMMMMMIAEAMTVNYSSSLCKIQSRRKDFSFVCFSLFSLFSVIKNKPKVDGDDSSNDCWRSDHEEELIRLISTPIVEAIAIIDENNREE